ncbi:MAG: cytochrome c maturation protein CcmE [Anaerolineae bacterium]|nr:cytochrome c maturation protein CcmE [Anaerolineae bacterium]
MVEPEDVARAADRRRLGGKGMRFLIGGLVILAALGYLIYSAASGSAAYYVTIDELAEQGAARRNVRVAGYVVGESIVWEARDMRLRFDMVDESGRLPVVYNGARPDMFRDGAEVVVEGKLGEEGVFEARSMLLKCPSKYEEAQ